MIASPFSFEPLLAKIERCEVDLQRVSFTHPLGSICVALFVTSKTEGKTTTDLCCNVIYFR